MIKTSNNKQYGRGFAITIWAIVASMTILYYVPWFKISISLLIPLFLVALIIVSTVFYLLSSKNNGELKNSKTRSRVFAFISAVLFIVFAIILTYAIIEIVKAPAQSRELFVGYAILGLAPILSILLTGTISFLIIFLKTRQRTK